MHVVSGGMVRRRLEPPYLVLEIKEMTKKAVKLTTTSTKGMGRNKGCRNGCPRSECMAQPPTSATTIILLLTLPA